nr:unnamed protein product [Digitaria exilis]
MIVSSFIYDTRLHMCIIPGAHVVECRRHPHKDDDYMLFVFGDAFVDAGNRPPTTQSTSRSRSWFYPYGISDSTHHMNATGRFSDGLVQSDYVARMLGYDESPPAYRLRESDEVDPSGVNFAMSGSGVAPSSATDSPSLSRQIDQFRMLVRHGIIDDDDLDDSVALISISGNHDYSGINMAASDDHITSMAQDVTEKIADGVKRLLDLGVSKVLVNSAPPIGCQPYNTRLNNYAQCDSQINRVTSIHNAALKKRLDGLEDVLLLDLDSAFTDIVQSKGYAPCCDTASRSQGYCGQEDAQGRAMYSLCPNPQDYFYWDNVYPTQAGWEAVMNRLQGPIMDFLGIVY